MKFCAALLCFVLVDWPGVMSRVELYQALIRDSEQASVVRSLLNAARHDKEVTPVAWHYLNLDARIALNRHKDEAQSGAARSEDDG